MKCGCIYLFYQCHFINTECWNNVQEIMGGILHVAYNAHLQQHAFEVFEKYYPGQGEMIVDFLMPNRDWEGCQVDDPSARVLANYGDSGK